MYEIFSQFIGSREARLAVKNNANVYAKIEEKTTLYMGTSSFNAGLFIYRYF